MPVENNETQTGRGRLQVSVFEVTMGAPAPNALVKVNMPDGTLLNELITDSSGQTPSIVLPTPPLEYSLAADSPQPYSSFDITVTLDGFVPVIIKGVQVLPDEESFQNVYLYPTTFPDAEPQIITINPPVLWGDYPPKIPEDAVKPMPAPSGLVILEQVVIPEFMIVHDGAPTNASATNYWVPYKDYIKNVASSEIYATWPEQTLIANILAINSFALNRVFTEWYRSRGFNFTITSSTAYDMAFSYGRNIYQEISVLVDEYFTTYITRPNIIQPLFTQFCDGQKVQCHGAMTQWGSKQMGEQGYFAMEILKSFYGSDIYLMQATQVEGIPYSFPGYNLQVGSRGAPVRTIQSQLNVIANNYPAIGKLAVDGVYGQQTRASVETFQQVFRLPITGIVDMATWYQLSYIYVSVTRMAELK